MVWHERTHQEALGVGEHKVSPYIGFPVINLLLQLARRLRRVARIENRPHDHDPFCSCVQHFFDVAQVNAADGEAGQVDVFCRPTNVIEANRFAARLGRRRIHRAARDVSRLLH